MNTTRTAAPATTPAEYATVTDALRTLVTIPADFDSRTHAELLAALTPAARAEYDEARRFANRGAANWHERYVATRDLVARRDAIHAGMTGQASEAATVDALLAAGAFVFA